LSFSFGAPMNPIDRAERGGLTALYLLTTTARDYFPRLGFVPCPRAEAPLLVQEILAISRRLPRERAPHATNSGG
jgi:N-acetylglutamate synthase-like GNAT family acetyltransferase